MGKHEVKHEVLPEPSIQVRAEEREAVKEEPQGDHRQKAVVEGKAVEEVKHEVKHEVLPEPSIQGRAEEREAVKEEPQGDHMQKAVVEEQVVEKGEHEEVVTQAPIIRSRMTMMERLEVQKAQKAQQEGQRE